MAAISCPLGHRLWNGDGKPVVWAFRINYIREFSKENPECRLGEGNTYLSMSDCTWGVPGEDLDCWYCDICKTLVVYVDDYRYDYKQFEVIPDISEETWLHWEEYIAFRNLAFDKFDDYSQGMSPIKALEGYEYEYRYRLSPDKRTILAIDKNGIIRFGFWRMKEYDFSQN